MTADQPQGTSSWVAGWMTRHGARGETLIAGCAEPDLALELARGGSAPTVFDVDGDAVQRVRAAATEASVVLRAEHVEAAEWPFENGAFDAVVLDRLLEHQLRPERMLSESRRVLRDAGCLLVRARYGLGIHGEHADALYLARLAELVAGRFVIEAIELVGDTVLASARPGDGKADPAMLLAIAERRLQEIDGAVYRLARELETERARAERLEASVRAMRASRGWQITRALREGSRAPAKLPRLLTEALRRKR